MKDEKDGKVAGLAYLDMLITDQLDTMPYDQALALVDRILVYIETLPVEQQRQAFPRLLDSYFANPKIPRSDEFVMQAFRYMILSNNPWLRGIILRDIQGLIERSPTVLLNRHSDI